MACFTAEEAQSAVRAFRGCTGQYLFCSTVDVYTKAPQAYPIREDAGRQPDPGFAYALEKSRCENLLLEAHGRGDFAVTLLRPAQTYGEGARLVQTFGWGTYLYDRFRRGLPLIVHGDGTSLWAPCHRDDVARAFANAAGNPNAYGKAYNLTGDEWLTWNGYYGGIAEALGVPLPRLVHLPTDLLARAVPTLAHWCNINFKYSNVFDNGAAKRDLGFRYTVPWVEGVRRTVAWLDAHDTAEKAEAFPFYDQLIEAWDELSGQLTDRLAGFDIAQP
ncbi:MAG TPA: NAD-dependent epimerase/dehydratase family protein, partial [Cytophagales bacterium]